MESNRFDVVVVGAGLAGLVAAETAALQNLRVALVATGPGSFVLGSGSLKAQDVVPLCAEGDLREAIAFFCKMAESAGCPFEGGISSQRYLPTILGDFQGTALAPRLLWNAEPRRNSSTAIVGIRRLSGFDENFIAEQLNEQARKICSGCTYTARHISLPRDFGIPVSPLRIAACFDRDPGFRAELVEALRPATAGVERILLPGILGLDSSDRQIAEFEHELGCSIAELPTLPPSIPGLRLFHRLWRHLHRIGVEIFLGFPVQKIEIHDGLCTVLQVASPGHPMLLRGESVVLAAGVHSAGLLGSSCAGLDEQMRPLASAGSVMAWNLFVAGSSMPNGAHSNGDTMRILTGYRAGTFAAPKRGLYAAR